jgi:Alpha/beta hydrolase family
MIGTLRNTLVRARQSTLPLPAGARTVTTAIVARALVAALLIAGLCNGPAAWAVEPAPPAETTGPTFPGGPSPQLLPPEGLDAPAVPTAPPAPAVPAAPLSEGKAYEAVPPPTPDLTGSPAPIATVPCDDGYWIASSWRCRQTAPHGCACGDLDFYHVGGGGSQLLNRDAFTASLTPGVPVCIVVHGSFTNWKGLCDDCAPVLRWIRSAAPQRPLQVLFYTWPSQGGITYEPHLDVAILGARASFNSVYLAELVARIPPGHPVCLVGHSHGARMVAAALHELGGGEVDHVRLTWPAPPNLRVRGVLVAGALDHHWLDPGQRFEMALCRTECLLVLRNDHDIVLTFYPLRKPFSKRALGERGLSHRDLRQLGPLSSKVAVLDVTRSVQTGHVWQHYYSCPEIAAAIAPYIYYLDDAQPTALVPPAPAVSSSLSLARPAN